MSARSMNRLLNQLNIQYQSGGTWVLYAKYQDQGYTTTETVTKDILLKRVYCRRIL